MYSPKWYHSIMARKVKKTSPYKHKLSQIYIQVPKETMYQEVCIVNFYFSSVCVGQSTLSFWVWNLSPSLGQKKKRTSTKPAETSGKVLPSTSVFANRPWHLVGITPPIHREKILNLPLRCSKWRCWCTCIYNYWDIVWCDDEGTYSIIQEGEGKKFGKSNRC